MFQIILQLASWLDFTLYISGFFWNINAVLPKPHCSTLLLDFTLSLSCTHLDQVLFWLQCLPQKHALDKHKQRISHPYGPAKQTIPGTLNVYFLNNIILGSFKVQVGISPECCQVVLCGCCLLHLNCICCASILRVGYCAMAIFHSNLELSHISSFIQSVLIPNLHTLI